MKAIVLTRVSGERVWVNANEVVLATETDQPVSSALTHKCVVVTTRTTELAVTDTFDSIRERLGNL